MDRYMEALCNHKLLDSDAELALLTVAQSGHDPKCEGLCDVCVSAIEATNTLVIHNMRLVTHIAKRFVSHGVELEDLVSEGVLGVIQAVKRFDFSRHCRFSTVAFYSIRNAMFETKNAVNLVRVPLSEHRLILKSSRGEELNLSECQLERMDRALHALFGKEYLTEDELDAAASVGFGVHDEVHYGPLEKIRSIIDSPILTDKQRQVVIMRFFSGQLRTLESVAQELGTSIENIRLIQKAALDKLRRRVRRETPG